MHLINGETSKSNRLKNKKQMNDTPSTKILNTRYYMISFGFIND